MQLIDGSLTLKLKLQRIPVDKFMLNKFISTQFEICFDIILTSNLSYENYQKQNLMTC